MEFSVKMQPELMMNAIWVIIGLVLLLFALAAFVVILVCRKAPRKKQEPKPVKPLPKTRETYRKEAIYSIDKTVDELNKKGIDKREAYQRLSFIMREFISKMTGVDFTTKTLSDFKEMDLEKIPGLVDNSYAHELAIKKKMDLEKILENIGYWYNPEFALKSSANFNADAEKAKQMVRSWS